MADTKATILRNGNFLGRLEADGSVYGVRGKVGLVSASGEVTDADGIILGSVDDTGLLMTASGDLCGTVDTNGNVWAGDETLGQVTGGTVAHAGAALFFLLRDEPALSLASAADTKQPVETLLPAPKRPSKRLAYTLAHVAVFAGLGIGVWSLGAFGVGKAREGARQSEVRQKREAAQQAAIQAQEAKKAKISPPAQTANTTSTEDVLRSRYASMDAAYNRRDADAFYRYHADGWRFVNKNGSSDTLRQARKYMVMRFSPDHPKRFLSCSITQRIVSTEASGDDILRAVIDQTVMTESIAKGRNRTQIRQEDTWQRYNGDWRCTRSHILSRQATPL